MNKYQYMTDGNAAIRMPVQSPDREDELLVVPGGQPKKKAGKARSMSFSTMLLLSVCTLLFAYFCYSYLQAQASITATQSRITSLQKTLSQLKSENDVIENRLNAQVDLEEVYRVATEELGMVYPDQNEQITYSTQKREYVRQHEDIPQ